MNALLVLSFLTISSSIFAKEAQLQGRASYYYYLELAPQEKIVLNFQSDKICKDDSDKIQVSEFDSKASYLSNEKKGNAAVRIKNIFVESTSVCSSSPIGKVDKKIIIGPFPNYMTHIRITTSGGVQVSQSSK